MCDNRNYKIYLLLLLFVIGCPSLAIAEQDTVSISYNSDWPPYSMGHGTKVTGILPALLKDIIENRMGYKTKHFGYPWKRAQEAVRIGDHDLMITFASDARKGYASVSEDIVYSLQQRPVVKRGSSAEQILATTPSPEALKNLRVCMMIGDNWSENFYKSNRITPDRVRNTQSCLRMIAGGRADVFLHPEAVVMANMRTTNTEDKLIHLPTAFAQMDFSLLLSKQSPLQQTDFMHKFNLQLTRMIADGSLNTQTKDLHGQLW